ncbi:MAG: glycosyl transferase family 28, partial [Chitinophagaceae bacterium]|nr:glycosyl transferase family 28 [Chitinophagaceae bacterium]
MEKQKKILIAPLDWGWGHATRCLPIIDYLISKNVNVVVAGNENYKNFIEEKYPSLPFIFLKGYDVRYAKSANRLGIKIALQVPKIISRLVYEYFWLKKIQDTEQFDAIISDNRYGLFSKKVRTVFMTHQVEIETPFFKKLVNVINRFFIKKHNYLWIPDDKDFNFAGKLSKPKNEIIPSFYLGNLSQLTISKNEVEKTIDLLCILSGPEPQRSILEEMIC